MIPRTFHFIWVGSALPGWASDNIDCWRDRHPQWEVRVWSDGDFTGLYNQGLYDRAGRVVPKDAVGQFRADLARYEILFEHGGFYADVDTRPLRAIDTAIIGQSEFAAMEDDEWIGNTYLAAVPGSPVMLSLVTGLANHVRSRGKARASVVSGPQYLTPIWRGLGAHVDTNSKHWFPYSYKDVKSEREDRVTIDPLAYAVHEWNHTRSMRRA